MADRVRRGTIRDTYQVGLSTQAETLDDGPVALGRLAGEVRLKAPATTDELQQTTLGVVVVLVLTKVVGQVGNARGQQSDLHLRGPDVTRVSLVLLDNLRLLFFRYGHTVLREIESRGAP